MARLAWHRLLGVPLVAGGLGLLWLSRWIVTGTRDSPLWVYVVYGAWTWVPGVLLLLLGFRLVLRGR